MTGQRWRTLLFLPSPLTQFTVCDTTHSVISAYYHNHLLSHPMPRQQSPVLTEFSSAPPASDIRIQGLSRTSPLNNAYQKPYKECLTRPWGNWQQVSKEKIHRGNATDASNISVTVSVTFQVWQKSTAAGLWRTGVICKFFQSGCKMAVVVAMVVQGSETATVKFKDLRMDDNPHRSIAESISNDDGDVFFSLSAPTRLTLLGMIT